MWLNNVCLATGPDLFGNTNLHFQQPAAVGLEVTVVNLTHGVHVLVPDLFSNCSLIGQKELIEKPMAQTTR